jgi:hypothetical protein
MVTGMTVFLISDKGGNNEIYCFSICIINLWRL